MEVPRKTNSFLGKLYHWCVESTAFLAGLLIIFIMLVMSAHVLMRYFLLMPIKWAVEITEYLMVWITFLGAAWVLREGAHIRVDIISARLKPKAQAILQAVTSAITAAICLLITIYGVILTYESVLRGAARTYLYTIPLWILIICIPIGCFLVFIEAARATRAFLQIKKVQEQ